MDTILIMKYDFDLNDCLMDNAGYLCEIFGLKLSDFTQWDTPLGHLVGMSNNEWLTVAYKTPSTQLAARPHLGVKELFQEIKSKPGGRINIVTATCLSEQQIAGWLNKYQLPFDRIIKTKVKSGPNQLVDDSPDTLRMRIKAGLPVKKFERPWNSDVDCPSFNDWRQFPL